MILNVLLEGLLTLVCTIAMLAFLIFDIFQILFSGIWLLWFIIGSIAVILYGSVMYWLLHAKYIRYQPERCTFCHRMLQFRRSHPELMKNNGGEKKKERTPLASIFPGGTSENLRLADFRPDARKMRFCERKRFAQIRGLFFKHPH